jgi:WD40 repeat protein
MATAYALLQGTVKVWDLIEESAYIHSSGIVIAFALGPSGLGRFVAVSDKEPMRVWDTNTWECVRIIPYLVIQYDKLVSGDLITLTDYGPYALSRYGINRPGTAFALWTLKSKSILLLRFTPAHWQ